MRSLAILGVSGHPAQALLRALEAESVVTRIVGIDRHPPRYHPSKLEFHPADLRHAPLTELLRGVDAVIYLAAQRDDIELGPGADDRLALRRAVDAASKVGAQRLVVLSSIAAYGAHVDNPVPIQEQSPLRPNPDVPLSQAWAELELLVEQLSTSSGALQVISLRSAPVVGPELSGSLALLMARDRLVIADHYDPILQLVHADDAAQACLGALRQGRRGVYHVAAPVPARLSSLYQAAGATVIRVPSLVLEALVPVASRFAGLPPLLPLLPLLRESIVVSTVATCHELGWVPRYSTQEAFLATRRALKDQQARAA